MIATTVALRDIADAEGFVAATIHRSGVILRDSQEREDLMAEGLAILCELAQRYEPHRAGYTNDGSFAGYASMFLPKRMQDAYRAGRPHTTRVDIDTGQRRTEYLGSPMSLHHDDLPQFAATMTLGHVIEDDHPAFSPDVAVLHDLPAGIASAIARLPTWDRGPARRVARLADQDLGHDEIARRLGMRRSEISTLRSQIAGAYRDAQHVEPEEPEEAAA